MQHDFTAAAVQMTSGPDKAANWKTAERLVRQAAGEGATLIVLPEYFNCLGDRRTMLAEAEPIPGPTSERLCEWAQVLRVTIVGGTICEQTADPAKAHNTSLVVDARGAVVARYRKLHLFDVDLPGRLTYCESSWLAAGEAISTPTIEVRFGAGDAPLRMAQAICYDLRFPELFRRFADCGTEVAAVPAAFTATTGRDHWELLCRARAVENQCFVVAANQWGRHAALETYGHSLIVDPWGVVLQDAGVGENIILANLSAARLAEVRSQLPALGHRRDLSAK